MNCPLAVYSPHLGALTETFIRRHVKDLLPGRTALFVQTTKGPDMGAWTFDGPLLVLNTLGVPSASFCLGQRVSRLLGRRESTYETSVVRHFLRKHHIKVLLGEYLDHSLPWLQVAKDLGIRFFVRALGYDVSERLRIPKWQIEYLKYNQSDGIIAVSRDARSKLLALGLDPNKTWTVPCGVDVPLLRVQRPDRKPIRCVAVGRMVVKKAPMLTLDAFRLASEVYPGLHLDFVGNGHLFSAAQQFVRTFGMESHVTFHGSQPFEKVQSIMADADIFLQHSMVDPDTGDEEGLPVAILNAMAASLPVISTRHAGIPEAVLDGVTGMLVEERDSAHMAEHLLLLAQHRDLRQQMGEAGWQRARDLFSWERERADLLRILDLPC